MKKVCLIFSTYSHIVVSYFWGVVCCYMIMRVVDVPPRWWREEKECSLAQGTARDYAQYPHHHPLQGVSG